MVRRDYLTQKALWISGKGLVARRLNAVGTVVSFAVIYAIVFGVVGLVVGWLAGNSVFNNALAQQLEEKSQNSLQVRDLRISEKEGPDNFVARVVVEINRPAPFRIFTLQNPERLIIDFPRADTRQLLPTASFKRSPDGLVTAYRYGLFRAEILRFVFEFANPISVLSHGTLTANSKHGFRVFVDTTRALDARLRPPAMNFASRGWKKYEAELSPLWQKAAGKAVATKTKTPKKTTKQTDDTRGAIARSPIQLRRIVIDAGHGGIDPGARANGLLEKNVVLTFAREIARTLTASGRYKVFLTRDGDFFIPLRQRYEIAHRLKADLLISVHADYLKNKAIRGATVYTLSEVASDRESAELASRENNADVLVGQNLSEFTPDVSTILIDLARKSTNRKSWYAAEKFVVQLKKSIPTLKKAHRYAGFVVLKSPNIPSLLLELGYMSNANDARSLKQPAFRKKVSVLVLRALDAYFKDG